ncbi:MAG: Ig-like domain-containing protein [Anaerolineae bacterium]|nr:Ig-like domain-containing protein [Anaerolineae bacterium]
MSNHQWSTVNGQSHREAAPWSIRRSLTILYLLSSTLYLLLLPACSLNDASAQATDPTPIPIASPTPTPTSPPPPPQVAYTPVAADTVSPIIVQRFPRRGEELPPNGSIELTFDRAMDQAATAGAFTLQVAADQPQKIDGQTTWPDARTMRFTPSQPLDRATVYDAILTQAATAEDGAPLAEPFTFRFSTPGYLEVTQVVPADGTTDVETDATITVMFNRPVVALTSLEEAENFPQPLEFEPAVAGQGEWLNTSIYVFKPEKPMSGGTTFKVRVKPDLTDAGGQTVMAGAFEWSFTTQPPEVVFVSPSDGQTLVPIETAVQVTFNQAVDPQSVEANFDLSAGGFFGGGSIKGQFQVISETVTFTPTERLEFDTTYQVRLEAGITSVAGGQGMVSPYSFSFTTVPLPKIVSTEPQDGERAAYPYTDFRITFNTPISPATVMPHVSMTPPLPITPTEIYTYYSPWDNTFSISFGAKPSTDYEVRITPGIEDPYGNKTQENLTVNFRTAPLPPNYQLRIPDLIGTYDAGLAAKMIVSYVNLTDLNLRLYRLDPLLIQRPYWEWNDFVPAGSDLIRDWSERLEAAVDKQSFHTIDLVESGGALEPGLYYLEADSPQIPDDQYNDKQRHIMVVSETNLTLKAGQYDTLVWATNLASGQPAEGLEVTFFDDDRRRLGAATTDANGIARLDLGKRDNRSGILAVVLPNANGEGFTAVAENWAQGVSPYDFGLNNVTYGLPQYTAHIYTDRPIYRPGQTVDFKGILRTEDDVKFGRPDLRQVHLVVRNLNYEEILNQTVDLSPAGTFNGEIKLEDGAALGNYVIAIDFNNQYFEHYFQVSAYRAPEFEVTVEPAQTAAQRGESIAATINTSYFFGGPLAGAEVSWNILAESYRFKPAQLGNYNFDDSDDPYVCFDCWWWYQDTVPQPVMSGSGQSDASGQLLIELDGQELDSSLVAGSHRIIIEASATGPDNQVISGRAEVILHKGDYYIGLSPQEYVADAGEETAIDLVAVDWAAERLPDKELNVQIIRYEWVNTFVEEGGGGYWKYETKKELVDEFNVTTDSQGEAVARFTPPQGGSYQIIAQDAATLTQPDPATQPSNLPTLQSSPIRSSIFVWVAGDENISWRRENHDRITLISDKAEYTPGETAEILIPSPFEGEHEALVTVERGRIIQYEVIKMTGSSQVYNLPITDSYAPNIYVSVVLVQGREGPQEGDAPRLADYKVGLLPIDVKPVAQVLKVNLTPSVEQAQPGEEISYNLEVTTATGQPVGNAEFSLDLVDKAVLSLLPRQPEAIIKAFYDRRGLGISTASGLAVSVNQLLLELAEDLGLDQAQFAEKAAGEADMAESEALAGAPAATALPAPAAAPAEEMARESAAADATVAQNVAVPAGVEVREEFSDTAYWNPVVVTDPNGQAVVRLTLPDNLTTWVMRGVGVTNETQVGEATSELIVTKPLLIRPVAPRFLVVDDRAELAANITNNTDADIETEVTLAAQGLNISQETAPVQTVTIPARGESKVTWNVIVPDVITTELVFAAVSTDGQYTDAAKPRLTTGPDGSLLVHRYTAPDIVGTANQLADPAGGSLTEVVALPPNFDERKGELSVQLDPSLAAGMRDGLTYLEHYPYECTEQTISRFLPNVLTYNALQSLGIENKELADKLPGLVEQGLGKLYVQQKPDGGWGWWADDESNVHITAYVVFALTKAQQAGVNVSATVLANGQNFLLTHLQSTRELNTTFDANRHAFVLYALAEGGQAPRDSLETLFDAREKLAHYGRAYLALALNLADEQGYQANIQTLLSDINNAAILSATGAHWEEDQYDWWAMNTDTRSTAIILDTLAKLDPDNAMIPNVVRWLMIARKDGIWETTQETAWALIALTDWMVETGELEADYDYSISLNDAEKISGTATKENVQESVKLTIPVANLVADASNRLTVARTDGNGRLYYSAHLKVYLPVEEIEPAERGIIVSRRYTLESCLAGEDSLASSPPASSPPCPEVREAKLGDVIRVDLTIIAPNDLYYVVVEDPLPAGAEAIDTGLATTSLLAMDPTLTRQSRSFAGGEGDVYYNYPYYWWWWRWYSRSELRDDKVVLFADYLPKGTYEYSYTMRATLPGDYHVIPTVASEFYFPEVFGRSDGRLLSIGR